MSDETQSALSLFMSPKDASCFCLVVLWHRERQECVGASAFVPDSGTYALGRGREPELGWRKPSLQALATAEVDPFDVPRISRHQLNIRAGEQGLFIRNLGRCQLFVDGEAQSEAWVRPGQMLALGQEFLLWVETRQVGPFLPIPGFEQPFGNADSWGWIGESEATWALRHQLWKARSGAGHVLVRGAPGTGRTRVAESLDAKPYHWRDSPSVPPEGNLWVSDPVPWFAEQPNEAIAVLKQMEDSGRRVIITLNHSDSELDFKHEAMFLQRLELPGLNDRLADIVFIATAILKELATELPKANESIVDGRALFTPEWVLFLIRRQWTSHGTELRALLLDAVHRSENGWLSAPEDGGLSASTEPLTPIPSQWVLSSGVVDFERREFLRGEETIRLTPLEIRVLKYFSQRIDREVTKEDLYLTVWGTPYDDENRALKNTIRRLRQKLEMDRENPVHLTSVWGVGYRFLVGE